MAKPQIFIIKETEKEIKNFLKKSIPFIAQRLQVLLILKQNEKTGISKREVSKLEDVEDFIGEMVTSITETEIMKICGFHYVFF